MTPFAFVAGLSPFVVASGAGAIGNRTIGGSSLGGMLSGTLFGCLLFLSCITFLQKWQKVEV